MRTSTKMSTRTSPTMTDTRNRRAPALGARILVAAAAVAITVSLVGWMGRAARADGSPAAPVPQTIRRVVVVQTPPQTEPYIALEAVPAGRNVVVVIQPAPVIRRAPAPAAATQAAPPVTVSSGSK